MAQRPLQPRMFLPPAPRRAGRVSARGFTLVELLIVIAVILVLIGLVAVASRGVSRAASTARTTTMLSNINQAIALFKGDLGFEPPLISKIVPNSDNATTPNGGIQSPELEAQLSGTNADALKAYRRLRYNSQFSLPAYLLGMGSVSGRATPSNTTSYPPNTNPVPDTSASFANAALDDGVPGPGIRHPGALRVWKKPGTAPNTVVHSPDTSGRRYGPYLSIEQMASALEIVQVVPGDDTHPICAKIAGLDSAASGSNIWMYRFIEPSGEAIRYYRSWPTRDPMGNPPNQPSVVGVPVELRNEDAVRVSVSTPGFTGVPHPSDSAVMSSSYMLLAPNVAAVAKAGAATSDKPYETDLDELFEECMSFSTPNTAPRFNPADVGAGNAGATRTKRLFNFAGNAVRMGPL